jgi:hypothetical protein
MKVASRIAWMSFLLLLNWVPSFSAAGEKVDSAKAKIEPADSKGSKQKIAWFDIRLLGLEGQGWHGSELAAPFDRLPAKAQKLVRPDVWGLSRHSTGLFVRFLSDSPAFYARWTVTNANLAMPHMPATGVSGLDLYARTDKGWHWMANGRPAKTTTSQLLTHVAPEKREHLLYLPLYNGVSSVELGISDGTSLWKGDVYSAGRDKPVVFYGTSITQGGCASRPGMVHTSILQRRLDRPMINLGFSGNGRLEMELAELMSEIDAAVYVIDCLPNIQAKDTTARAEPFVKALRKKRPQTPILLVEDRTYGNAVLQPKVQEGQRANRAALRTAFENLQKAGVPELYYLAGDRILADDGDDMVDGSHPTDLGFLRYADAFEPPLKSILKAK